MTTTAAYGTWVSPIDAAHVVAKTRSFAEIRRDGDDLYWLEMRPVEGGRQVLMRRSGLETTEVLGPDTSVRTLVHEYGGGGYLVTDGTVVYSDFDDQRLYRLDPAGEPKPITHEPPRPRSIRYADGVVVGDAVVCIRETHPDQGEAVNELVAVTIDGPGEPTVLVSGPDFVSSPRVSPGGKLLAWLSWDHPNMPWDETELWVAPLDRRSIGEPRRVAGGPGVSVVQPEWGPDGALYYIADPTGWWNLYRYAADHVQPVLEVELEFGFPQWTLERRSYGFLSAGRIAVVYFEAGIQRLAILHPDASLTPIDIGYGRYREIVTDGEDHIAFVGSHPERSHRIVELDVETRTETVAVANPELVDPAYVPEPEPISFPTAEGEVAHGFFYPPTNPGFEAPEDELPPLIVEIHGGPTSNVYPVPSLEFMYWTSRGIGVVDVNYRGSTGYGRAYRDRLKGEWGLVDVEDAVAAARFLAAAGLADADRLVITGGSAGGFTALAALAFHDAFAAGSSYYGVSDLELLDEETHKFESRYLDSLVRPAEALRERSPIHHLDGFDRPVILFQGLDDPVVPHEQAELIAEALDRQGVTHALVLYEGEGHGFRSADNIVDALESELSFFSHVLGFEPAGAPTAVELEHP